MLRINKKRKSATDQSFALSPYQNTPGCQARKPFMHLPWMYTDMIREKAIFSKLNQLNISDQQLFDVAVSDFDPDTCACPECEVVGCLVGFRSYERHMISVDNGKRIDIRLSVPRFLCGSCGHTHALLPDVLIPYGSYSLRFIIVVLLAYLDRACTVADLCEQWHISISTLYDWIHLFIDQHNAWCEILERICWVCRKAIDSVSSVTAFPRVFFSRFHFSFLQRRQTSHTVPVLLRIGGTRLHLYNSEMYFHPFPFYPVSCNSDQRQNTLMEVIIMSANVEPLKVAHFRFALIAPVIQRLYPDASEAAYNRRVTKDPIIRPNGTPYSYSPDTLERWTGLYRKKGMDGLIPGLRKDKDISRSLSADAINEIYRLREKYPRINGVMIHQMLIQSGFLDAKVSVRSVQRFLKENELKSARNPMVVDRKAYEMPEFGCMWQADTAYLPYITENGRSRRTFLIMIIDDHSKMIVGGCIFYNDNAYNYQKVLKQAISTYGLPDKIYMDHGSSFENEQLTLILDSLGIVESHAPVRDGAAKGYVKINITKERLNTGRPLSSLAFPYSTISISPASQFLLVES